MLLVSMWIIFIEEVSVENKGKIIFVLVRKKYATDSVSISKRSWGRQLPVCELAR